MTDEQATAPVQYAFRCNNCNSLAEAGHAGERQVPAKCTTCGKGVRFTEDGIKTYDEDNWTVLADLDGDGLLDVLDYHGITPDDITRHVPAEPADPEHQPVNIEVSANEAVEAQHEGAQS